MTDAKDDAPKSEEAGLDEVSHLDESTSKVSLSPEPKGFSEDPLMFEGEEEGNFLDDLEGELASVRGERDDMRDRMLRALAEAENARKRADRDRRDAELYGGTRLARDLLSVYDNMNRALDTIDDSFREQASALIEGLELTKRELLAAFTKHKIEKQEPEFGEKFDPQLHQAMFEAPVPNAPAGTIIQVMNPGFTIGDRLLRPAQVGVSSTPASQISPKAEAEPSGDTDPKPEAG